jgi:sec-independent protein translocase protein TatB
MFGIGLPELVIILVVALLVVGPSKLPEVARSIGRALGEFRRMADDVKETLEQEIDQNDAKKEEPAGPSQDEPPPQMGESPPAPEPPGTETVAAEKDDKPAPESAGVDHTKTA